jgi:hypothetical protein
MSHLRPVINRILETLLNYGEILSYERKEAHQLLSEFQGAGKNRLVPAELIRNVHCLSTFTWGRYALWVNVNGRRIEETEEYLADLELRAEMVWWRLFLELGSESVYSVIDFSLGRTSAAREIVRKREPRPEWFQSFGAFKDEYASKWASQILLPLPEVVAVRFVGRYLSLVGEVGTFSEKRIPEKYQAEVRELLKGLAGESAVGQEVLDVIRTCLASSFCDRDEDGRPLPDVAVGRKLIPWTVRSQCEEFLAGAGAKIYSPRA